MPDQHRLSPTRWKCSTWPAATVWPKTNLNMGMEPSPAAIKTSGLAITRTLIKRRSRNKFNLSATFLHLWGVTPLKSRTCLNILRVYLPSPNQSLQFARISHHRNVLCSQREGRRLCLASGNPTQWERLLGTSRWAPKENLGDHCSRIKLPWISFSQKMIKLIQVPLLIKTKIEYY